MKIISWNINGLRARIKDGTFADLIGEHDPDVLFLQEVRADFSQLPKWFRDEEESGYCTYLSKHMKGGYAGVMGCVKSDLISALTIQREPKNIFEGRAVQIDAGENLTSSILSLYSPNAGSNLERLDSRMHFEYNLRAALNTGFDEIFPDIICGDLNVAPTAADCKSKSIKAGTTSQERGAFTSLLENLNHNFIDAWRYINGDKQEMTWYSNFDKEKKYGMRIDHFLVREEYKENIKDCYIIQTDRQDHQPIVLEYENNY